MNTYTICTLAIFLIVGTAILWFSRGDENAEITKRAIPLAHIHEEVTQKFIKAMGFGFMRRVSYELSPDGEATATTPKDHEWFKFATGNEPYQVNLIGLVNDPDGSVYQSTYEIKRRIKDRATNRQEIESKDDKVKSITIPNLEFSDHFLLGLTHMPEIIAQTNLDKNAIAAFTKNPMGKPYLQKENGIWIGYGSIRATEAKCIKCHEVENGALLGLFRYEFFNTKN